MHRAHDYAHLLRRWRNVARRSGLKLETFAEVAGDELVCLCGGAYGRAGGLYISAGIHGDEAGSTEGLITWAEKHADSLRTLSVFILPCLNPWGLQRNSRFNEAGIDLNRAFDRDDVPSILALREKLHGHRFSAALALHEDYDAQGIYLYEGRHRAPFWGESILRRAGRVIPIDPRTKIDIGRPKLGIMRRRFDARRHALLGGLPEAVYLQRSHTARTITFETPSEFALERRVAAQVRCIETCIRLLDDAVSEVNRPKPRQEAR